LSITVFCVPPRSHQAHQHHHADMLGLGVMDLLAAGSAAAAVGVLVVGSFDGTDGSVSGLSALVVATALLTLWRPDAPRAADGSLLPGPGRGLPFAGCTKEFLDRYDDILEWCVELSEQVGWGKTWGFTTLRIGAISGGACYLASPAAVQHVLKDNYENYEKGPKFRDTLGDFLGNGIFSSDGAAWKHHRKIAVNMFSKRLLEEGMAVALLKTQDLITRLDEHAASGEAVDLQQCYFAFTMDTFCSIAFGKDLDSQNTPHRFTRAFDTAQHVREAPDSTRPNAVV
jgi:hypothetical protein